MDPIPINVMDVHILSNINVLNPLGVSKFCPSIVSIRWPVDWARLLCAALVVHTRKAYFDGAGCVFLRWRVGTWQIWLSVLSSKPGNGAIFVSGPCHCAKWWTFNLANCRGCGFKDTWGFEPAGWTDVLYVYTWFVYRKWSFLNFSNYYNTNV